MKLEHLDARCFLCGEEYGPFTTSHRVCDCVKPRGFPASELSCYVTILPEPKGYSPADLPSLWTSDPSDVFALSADAPNGWAPCVRGEAAAARAESERAAVASARAGSGTGSTAASGARPIAGSGAGPAAAIGARKGFYPFPLDLLATEHHLRCGNTIVHRSSSLEDVTGFGQVHVINMSSYQWTCTLKDPRSWAILNTALASGITDLAVWTAGNAGLSLAKLAYVANRRLPREKRLQVHAIVDSDVAPEIRTRLRLWQCEVLDIFRRDKPVLNPEEIKGLVAARLKRSRRQLDEGSYWDVTDGWDGVGLLMYRFLAAQIIRDMAGANGSPGDGRPLYVVLPVGTGDLLMGFSLGLQDCERAGLIAAGSCKIVGVMPAGASVLHNIRNRTIPQPAASRDAAPSLFVAPVMPKLTSTHTPLAPCLSLLEREKDVQFLTVTEHDQMRAGKHVLSAGIDDGLACEPSALAAFAALPHLHARVSERETEDDPWRYQSRTRVLVVNSGLGILGREEEDLLRRARGE